MVRSLLLLLIIPQIAFGYLPGEWQQGKCMTFAVAYAQTFRGSKLIVMTKPPLGHLVVMTSDGEFVDNLHPFPQGAKRLIDFYEANGYETEGWKIFAVIDYDNRTEHDMAVIDWLKKHETGN